MPQTCCVRKRCYRCRLVCLQAEDPTWSPPPSPKTFDFIFLSHPPPPLPLAFFVGPEALISASAVACSSSLTTDAAADEGALSHPLASESLEPPALDRADPYLPSLGGSSPGLLRPEMLELIEWSDVDDGALRRDWIDLGR